MKIKNVSPHLPLIPATIILLVIVHCYISFFIPPGGATSPVVVEFQPGAGFRQIAEALREKGIIRNPGALALLARIRGSTKKIQAGDYEFNASMPPLKILEKLEKGLVLKHPITIPEGYNIREIAELLEKNRLSKKDRFMAKASDRVFLSSLGIDAPTAEGYLFPETYNFFRGMGEEAIIKNMVLRFKDVFTGEMEVRARTLGLSVSGVVTLASIVEKESGEARERPLISRVFLNRLRMGIALQSDPTVIYGIKDFDGNLTKKDLMAETPYNTYRKAGLPAGPIANPGIGSIKAVLYPEDCDYLYFVSKNDGTHYFSKTLSEHNRAVYRYQTASRKGKKAS